MGTALGISVGSNVGCLVGWLVVGRIMEVGATEFRPKMSLRTQNSLMSSLPVHDPFGPFSSDAGNIKDCGFVCSFCVLCNLLSTEVCRNASLYVLNL